MDDGVVGDWLGCGEKGNAKTCYLKDIRQGALQSGALAVSRPIASELSFDKKRELTA